MKTYWLYLKPYTFLWVNESHALIYNSLSNEGIEIQKSGKVGSIIEKLQLHSNQYCVEITEENSKDFAVNNFISKVRNSFSGDIIEVSPNKIKPIVFPPKLKINNDIKVLKKYPNRSVGENVLSYLDEISVYINGMCSLNCQHCKVSYLQTSFCTKNNNILDFKRMIGFFDQVKSSSISQINILGGNIFEYHKLFDLINALKKLAARIVLHTHYLNVPEKKEMQWAFLSNQNCKVIVNFPVKQKEFTKVVKLVENNRIQTEWVFSITTKSEYEKAISYIDKHELTQFKIVPIFTGKNLIFFEKFIFLDKVDILTTKQGQREIFGKQAINYFDFGKLTIMSNGKVYANPNHESLGTINHDIRQLVYRELDGNTSWRRIRNMKPCHNCIYQYLCPSPSNYEIVINKPNLCNI